MSFSPPSEPRSADGDNPAGNPFASPARPEPLVRRDVRTVIWDAVRPTPEKYVAVGRTVVVWELLRIPYNGLMLIAAAAGMVLALPVSLVQWEPIALQLLDWALYSNACFLLGHFVAGYATWLGVHRRWMTYVVFGLGTSYAAGVAFLIGFSAALANFFGP